MDGVRANSREMEGSEGNIVGKRYRKRRKVCERAIEKDGEREG